MFFSPTSASGARRMLISIQPLDMPDISACATLSAAAFATDPHTVVKQLGQRSYDMFDMTRSDLEKNLKRQNSLCVKAVDNRGIIVGHATWVFSDGDQKRASTRDISDGESGVMRRENSASKTNRLQARSDEATNGDPIERLQALEEVDMQDWLNNLVSADTPCMLVVGLAVSSDHQGQGIGSALLRHGNAIADERRLSIWVHSSHQAYNAYRKAGFETRRELMIDLDDYAPRPPRDGESTMMRITGQLDDGRWGQYVIRYMKRQPGSN